MNIWIIATLVLSLVSPISYTKSMLAGESKPHRITRFIVWLVSIAGILGVWSSTNAAGRIFAFIFLARATYLLLMSLKFGVGGTTRLDKICLAIGLLAIVAYALTNNGALTIFLGITADFIGYIPTFVKTYHKPKSEDPVFFGIEGIAALCGVFAVWELSADIILPIFFTLSCVIMEVLIYRKEITKLFVRN